MANERRSGFGFWDRLILFTAWVVTCGLVYLLGFYVGKGTQAERLGLEERIVRLPVTSSPPREGQRPKTDGELTFYDKLVARQGGERRPTEPTPPAKAATSPAHDDAAAAPAGTAVAKDSRPPAAAKPAAPPAHAPARVAVLPRPVPVKSVPPPVHVASPKPAAPTAVIPPPPPAAPQVEARVTPPAPLPIESAAAGGWTVLANPTRSREDAEALERQLRGRGYDATVVRVLRDGDTWYRLRVGRYPSADQAAAAMHKLREHEGVEHAFVASE